MDVKAISLIQWGEEVGNVMRLTMLCIVFLLGIRGSGGRRCSHCSFMSQSLGQAKLIHSVSLQFE